MIAKIISRNTDGFLSHTEVHGYTTKDKDQAIVIVQKSLISKDKLSDYQELGFIKIGREFKGYFIVVKTIAIKLSTFDKIVYEVMESKTKVIRKLIKEKLEKDEREN